MKRNLKFWIPVGIVVGLELMRILFIATTMSRITDHRESVTPRKLGGYFRKVHKISALILKTNYLNRLPIIFC